MSILTGKKIILGITGSIAAYKAAHLIRLLIKQGCEVKVIMTKSATLFISELTLSTLSKNKVYTDLFEDGTWHNHVELGLWADLMVIAPATANTLAKMANGQADNMLLATYLSAKCKVMFAPAMDLDMWHHPSTKHNIARLISYGNELIPVSYGELASGLVGDGRLAEPEEIVKYLESMISPTLSLIGTKMLITAGPTFEAMDPVRFIGNHSSGKMGIAIAEEAANRGAEVFLILGPSSYEAKHKNIKTTNVVSAQDMYEACQNVFDQCQIIVLSAAVADYKSKHISSQKIKKEDRSLNLELIETIDIAATLGKAKKKNQLLVGFALETTDELVNAKKKIEKKNFDFIVLNSLQDKGAGFKHDTNKISIIHKGGKIKKFELKNKSEVAKDIIDEIILVTGNK